MFLITGCTPQETCIDLKTDTILKTDYSHTIEELWWNEYVTND